MTQEEKQLLLTDLCARLPYGVKIQTWYDEIITSDLNTFPYSTEEMDKEGMWDQLDNFKPYLRPMSSMTNDERKEYVAKCNKVLLMRYNVSNHYPLVDWLLSHHFDYRGLIEKGLALEAPEGMYKTE